MSRAGCAITLVAVCIATGFLFYSFIIPMVGFFSSCHDMMGGPIPDCVPNGHAELMRNTLPFILFGVLSGGILWIGRMREKDDPPEDRRPDS